MCTGTHDFIPAALTARVNINYLGNGQHMANVLHFRNATGWDETSLATLADKVLLAWTHNLQSLTSNAIQVDSVQATDVSTESGVGVVLDGGSTFGTNTDAAGAPNNVTAATKFGSGLTGRSFRGRVYFVGMTKAQTTGNALSTGVATALTNAWEDFFQEIFDSTAAEHVIVSYCHNKAWRTTAVVTPVTQYSTNNDSDSMRRRLNTRGS